MPLVAVALAVVLLLVPTIFDKPVQIYAPNNGIRTGSKSKKESATINSDKQSNTIVLMPKIVSE